MSYKLYTDKQEVFECKIHLEGASLTKATSRILVETKDLKLMFECSPMLWYCHYYYKFLLLRTLFVQFYPYKILHIFEQEYHKRAWCP